MPFIDDGEPKYDMCWDEMLSAKDGARYEAEVEAQAKEDEEDEQDDEDEEDGDEEDDGELDTGGRAMRNDDVEYAKRYHAIRWFYCANCGARLVDVQNWRAFYLPTEEFPTVACCSQDGAGDPVECFLAHRLSSPHAVTP